MFLKKILIIIFAATAIVACNSNYTFQDSTGKFYPKSELSGKWLVINYWASWCEPCRKEIPELNKFYLAHKNKDVLVFGVNYDHVQGDKLKQIIQKMNVKFPVLISDPSKRYNIKSVTVLPVTYLISPKGKIKKVLYGPQSRESIEKVIDHG